jgi:hypothetical protein
MAVKSERRSIKLHQRAALILIREQSGTLQKATLEAVMNSVDAGSSSVDIRVCERSVVVSDDGQGFRSRDEVESFFETLGQPHDPSERKVFGKFRMGRGQMFNYGRNVWRSGTFQMEIDVERDGLDYELTEGLPPHPGCRVEIALYQPLTQTAVYDLERELRKWVRYAPVPVSFNGDVVSTDPATERWDEVTDDAYVRFRQTGDVEVYNLGMFVKSYSNWQFGTGGTVVARKQLDVTLARNEILENRCSVWKRIRHSLDKRARTEVTSRKEKLTPARRAFVAEQVRTGRMRGGEVRELSILVNVLGVSVSPLRVQSQMVRDSLARIAAAPVNDRRGEKVHEHGLAYVLSDETLALFQCDTVADLIRLLEERQVWPRASHFYQACDVADVSRHLSDGAEIIPEDAYTPREKAVMGFLAGHIHALKPRGQPARKLLLGESDTALAWTDGRTYIAFSRQLLAEGSPGTLAFWHRLGYVALHEFAHDGDSTSGTQDHSIEFYRELESYLKTGLLGRWVAHAMNHYPNHLRNAVKRMNRRLLVEADRVARLESEQRAYEQEALVAQSSAAALAAQVERTAAAKSRAKGGKRARPAADPPQPETPVAAVPRGPAQFALI